jgi:phosphoribosylformylglycinamidine synthase
MDPVAQSAAAAIADLGHNEPLVRTGKKYWIAGIEATQAVGQASSLLANDAIEQVVVGPLTVDHLAMGHSAKFELQHVKLAGLDDQQLMQLSREGQLYLQLAEMQTLQAYFAELGRDPTDIELETLAQTWSEHCSHKTLGGRVSYRGPDGDRQYDSMLKETIFAATRQLRSQWGENDWCVSVFVDNAGVVRFDNDHHICFKRTTTLRPSSLMAVPTPAWEG